MKKKIIIIATAIVTLVVIAVVFCNVFLPLIKVKKTLDTVVNESYVFEGNYYLEVDDKLFKGSFEGAKDELDIHILADINGADIVDVYYAEDGEILFNLKPFVVWILDVLPNKLLSTVGIDKFATEDKFVSYEQVQDILNIDYDIVTDTTATSYSIKKLKESPFHQIKTDGKMVYYKITIDEKTVYAGVYQEKDEIILAVSYTDDDIYLEAEGEIDLSQKQNVDIPEEKISKGVVFVLKKVISWLKEKY